VNPVLEVVLDLVLVPGIGVDHVPAIHKFSGFSLEDSLDQEVECRVQRAEIGGRNRDEDDRDGSGLDEGLAIRPLDPLQLRPAGSDEADDPTALALGLRLLLAPSQLLALLAALVLAAALVGLLAVLLGRPPLGPRSLGRVRRL